MRNIRVQTTNQIACHKAAVGMFARGNWNIDAAKVSVAEEDDE